MKKETLMDAINNIDPDIIEKSVNYRPKVLRRNVTRIVAIAACLAILVTSVPLALMMSRRDETEPPKTTESETTKDDNNVIPPEPFKVIYCDADSIEELRETVLKNKKVEIKDFELYQSSYKMLSEAEPLEYTPDIPKTLTFVAGGKEFTGVFETLYYSTSGLKTAKDETLIEYQKIARYKIENTNKGYIYYRVSTKTIVDIGYISDFDDGITPNKYTRKELEETVYNDIKSIYGDDILSKYSLNELPDYDARNLIFEFTRKIGDYKTRSSITLYYNHKGELLHLSTRDVGVYDKFEKYMTEKKLLEIEKEAMDLFENRLVFEKELQIHSDGYLCIRYRLLIDVDESGKQKTRYIYYRVE